MLVVSDLHVHAQCMEKDEQREDGTCGFSRSLGDEIKLRLASRKYPERCRNKDAKRSFRSKAKTFRLEEDHLYYNTKKSSPSSKLC